MPPRPGHKRAVDSNGEGSSHATKKTRFVEPEDDPVNFAEEVDSQLETQHRKGRVRTEGYESDSSDDGEGVVLSRRTGADGAEEEEDEDMFAIGEKEEKEEQGIKKKKEEFLRLGDIEGQEFGKTTGEKDEDESEEEDEPEDEDDAERRKKAGMGFELSSFNMREEMEEGKFSADGSYVKTFDPHAAHDKWMEGLEDRDIKKARRQHKHQERIQKERMLAEERELEQLGGKDDIEKALVGMLKKGETVLEALQRLGAKAKKTAPPKKRPNNKTKNDDLTAPMAVDKAPAPKMISDIDHITHLASTLMSLGDTDIYSKTYEELVRSVRSGGKVDKDWIAPSADVKYEYKWDVPGASAEEGQVFGPFSEEEMRTWYKAAYFGAAGEKIKVRAVGGDWGYWDDVVT
ncbi:CD2 antigen cytoplasmic tail-binding protein 2/Lin1 [Abortiporus biennis]